MIELRWLVPPVTTTEPPRLQYRVDGLDVSRGLVWEPWQDVPTVVATRQNLRGEWIADEADSGKDIAL